MVQTHLREPPKLEFDLCAYEKDGHQPTRHELTSTDTKKKVKVTVINGQCIKVIVDGHAERLSDVLVQLDFADGDLYTAPLKQGAITGVAATVWKKVLDDEYKLSKNNRSSANFKHFLRDWVSALCKQKYPADVMARWILQGKCKIGKHDPFQKPSDWRTLFDANWTRITESDFLARQKTLTDVDRREAIYMNLRESWQTKVDGSPTIDIYNDDMDDLFASLDALWQQDKEDGILDNIARQREAAKIKLEADRKRKVDAAVEQASKKPKNFHREEPKNYHQSGSRNQHGPNSRGPANYRNSGQGYHTKGYHENKGYYNNSSGYQGKGYQKYNNKYPSSHAPSSNHHGGGHKNNGPPKDNRGRGGGNGHGGRGNLHAHFTDDRDDRRDDDRRSRSPSNSGRYYSEDRGRSPSSDRHDDFDHDRYDNYAVDYDDRKKSRRRSRSPDERKRSDRRRPNDNRRHKEVERYRDSSPHNSRRENRRDDGRNDGYNYDRDAYDLYR